jgi:(p)ppGpp synthase/HD superfamily hydrolase
MLSFALHIERFLSPTSKDFKKLLLQRVTHLFVVVVISFGSKKMNKLLSKAIALAASRHVDQLDKGGSPYILHALKVMHYLKSDDHELMCIGVMHDIVEDTATTYQELEELGFSSRIIEGVKCLTKIPNQTHDEYILAIKSNLDAVRVKMADLRHNSDIRRIKGVREKDVKRVIKYQEMYADLAGFLKENTSF